jgi:hypothetical protein
MSGLLNKALEGIRGLQANNWEFSYSLTDDEVGAIMLGVEDHNDQHEWHADSNLSNSQPIKCQQDRKCHTDCRKRTISKRCDSIATFHLTMEPDR